MATLRLSLPDKLFDRFEQLMQSRGKTVELGCREYLATLLICGELKQKEAQNRLLNELPLTPELNELISQTFS